VKIIRHVQGSPSWLLWRRFGLGGSDVATIMGVAPFEDCTIENVIREKVEGWSKPTNFQMRQGTRLEPTARTMYEIHAQCSAPPVCVEHDELPWARVSLDGLCRNLHRETDEPWVLELKVPNWKAHSQALAGEVPHYYRPQCQWQLFTCGLSRLDYVSFSTHQRYGTADRLAVVSVEPDEELQGEMLARCAEFWFRVEELREDAKRKPSEVA